MFINTIQECIDKIIESYIENQIYDKEKDIIISLANLRMLLYKLKSDSDDVSLNACKFWAYEKLKQAKNKYDKGCCKESCAICYTDVDTMFYKINREYLNEELEDF